MDCWYCVGLEPIERKERMSNFDWSEIKKLFDKETETLEGGGVIVRRDGSFEKHPEDWFGELFDTAYEEDGVWYYNEHPLYEDEFEDGGFRYRIQHQSAVPNEEFLEYWATSVLTEFPAVFLGATTVYSSSTDEDDEGEILDAWFLILKGLDA